MKPLLPPLLLLWLLPQLLATEIPAIALSTREPIPISIGTTQATILQFPRKITGLLGYGLTEGKEPGSYHYAHPKDSKILSLRNLMPGKEADIGVLLGQDLFLFHLKPDAKAPTAIRFLDTKPRRAPKSRKVSAAKIEGQQLDYATEKLLQVLKLARNQHVFQAYLPQFYKDAESRQAELRYDDGKLASVIRQLHRFPKEDALVLLGEIENRLDYPIRIDPSSFEVRVGERVYPAVLVDAPESIPTKGKVAAHVLVKGDAEGNRAHLSIKNDFRLIVSDYHRYEEHDDWGGYVDATLFGDPGPSLPETVTVNNQQKGSK